MGKQMTMYASKHYVPIINWKGAEQGALDVLKLEQKRFMTPLIQLVMPKQKQEDQLEEIVERFEKTRSDMAKKLIKVWGTTPHYIDTSLLFTTPLKSRTLNRLGFEIYKFGGTSIPVIHINDEKEIMDAALNLVNETKSGLGLRIIPSNLENISTLNHSIMNFLAYSGLSEKDVNLIVDIKETGPSSKKYSKYFELSQQIVNLQGWRTFTFVGSAYPESLSDCKLDEENLISRIEWESWREYFIMNGLKRMPAFGDYTIRHPIYKELNQLRHPTTSIKYTLENQWLIMKGKRQRFELYLASAATLYSSKYFFGESFSYGDHFIAEKAAHFKKYIEAKNNGQDIKGTGNTEDWLRAGINHHLSLVIHQIANLPDKSS